MLGSYLSVGSKEVGCLFADSLKGSWWPNVGSKEVGCLIACHLKGGGCLIVGLNLKEVGCLIAGYSMGGGCLIVGSKDGCPQAGFVEYPYMWVDPYHVHTTKVMVEAVLPV